MTNQRSSCSAAVGRAVQAGRIMVLTMIVARVLASCTQAPTATNAPTVPTAPAAESQRSTSIPPDPSEQVPIEGPSGTRLSTARAEAVLAYEFASLMKTQFGEDWREPVTKLLHMDFVAVGMTPEEQQSTRDFYRIVTDADLAASGVPDAEDDHAVVSFRDQLRGAASDVAFEVAVPTVSANAEDPDTEEPEGDGGDGDDCDSWQACAYRARNECQQYARDEAAVISAAAVTTCVFVGVISGTITANPLIGVGSGVTCRLLTSAYLNYIKRLLEEECTTLRCGYYPQCI